MIKVRSMLPEISKFMEFYTKLVEDLGDVDRANFYVSLLIGYGALLWKLGLISSEDLGKYFEKLRSEILEGPNQLNPYVMELLGILSEGINDETYEELIDKLRMLLREERLDRLEL